MEGVGPGEVELWGALGLESHLVGVVVVVADVTVIEAEDFIGELVEEIDEI